MTCLPLISLIGELRRSVTRKQQLKLKLIISCRIWRAPWKQHIATQIMWRLTTVSGRHHSCSSIWSQCSCAQCHMHISECQEQSRPSKSASRYRGRPTMCKAFHLQIHKGNGKFNKSTMKYYVDEKTITGLLQTTTTVTNHIGSIHPSIHLYILPSIPSDSSIRSIHQHTHKIYPSIHQPSKILFFFFFLLIDMSDKLYHKIILVFLKELITLKKKKNNNLK